MVHASTFDQVIRMAEGTGTHQYLSTAIVVGVLMVVVYSYLVVDYYCWSKWGKGKRTGK